MLVPLRPLSMDSCQAIFYKSNQLLSLCRPFLSLNCILWLPMSYSEHSRCVCWRLGWLSCGQSKPCPKLLDRTLYKKHAMHYLDKHQILQMPTIIEDPLSFLLNLLPTRKLCSLQSVSSWFLHRLIICLVLFELNHLHYQK